jgi:glycosyltransferase involved in cell wall biosynthesis
VILGIDAFNIRAGGGVTHLVEFLRASNPTLHGFKRVVIWGSAETLNKIDDKPWLVKEADSLLDRSLPFRIFWHRYRLRKLAIRAGCDILFFPGGSNASGFAPAVTMSQNLLPFELKELKRYGWSFYTLKFLMLRWTQGQTFKKSAGVIFLTEYARSAVLKVTGKLAGDNVIIPHGINSRFVAPTRRQRDLISFDENFPCRVLYVSSIEPYKHQWHVVEAIAKLRSTGLYIVLELVGPEASGIKRLKNTIEKVDPSGSFIHFRGAVPYNDLDKIYSAADIGVFASSCENLPNILLEGMASGLPMACSISGPMPEVLQDAGVYFDPEDVDSISNAILHLVESPQIREKIARAAFIRAQTFYWSRCANETFDFFAKIASKKEMDGSL